jgi:hypothetical protein
MDDERARQHGALTGESGVVTPPDVDDEFVPAERRAMEGTVAEQADTPPASPADTVPTDASPIERPIGDEVRIDPQDDRY